MAFFRNPDDAEVAKWEATLSKPDMAPYRDFPPWGLYTFKGGLGMRMTIIDYFPQGFNFKCAECDEDHAVPGPAVGVIADKRYNLLPAGHNDNDRGVAPLAMLEPCDLPAANEPVGIAGSRWAQ